LAVEETAQRYVRPVLRDRYVRLVRGGALDYLREFGFESELLLAMYAVTDALPGLAGGPNSPGSGHNLLVHNMARLPGSGGTWMVVRGGMGTVTRTIAAAARRAGARITLSAPVESIIVDAGVARGAVLENGVEIRARAVLAATDPHVLQRLVPLPAALRARIDSWLRLPGRTLKVNLALNGLPAFRALPEARGQHGTTVHLLPRHARDGVLRAVDEACADAAAGRLPDAPPLEWYLHSTLDPSLQDAAGHHSSALFVQGVPNEVAGSSWAAERDGYVEHLLRLVDEYAPGTSDLVVDVAALAPPDIAAHFGITTGHIFHVDNSVATIDRMPYATGVDGVYAGSAACHPAGSVIGAAGHNAARRILADLGVARRDVAHAGRHATNLDLPG
jgi:phytoene dehydrogenase-like protein